MEEALRIFELTQFVGDAKPHVRIRADAETAAEIAEGRCTEYSVPKIGFGDRAEAGDGAGFGQALGLPVDHMGRMHTAPARVDGRVVEQPGDRPRAGPGKAIRDLLD